MYHYECRENQCQCKDTAFCCASCNDIKECDFICGFLLNDDECTMDLQVKIGSEHNNE
jgi:hypothetical protein